MLTLCLQDLNTARLQAAKRDLIKSELRNLTYRADALPDEVGPYLISIDDSRLMKHAVTRAGGHHGSYTGRERARR
jgi:hypothetical protein